MDFEELQKLAQAGRKKKITREQLQAWGHLSAQKRLKGMSNREKSEYFRLVKKGVKVSEVKLVLDKRQEV